MALSTLFGAAHALAASLDTSTATLGGGQAVVAACQSAPLSVSFETSYDPASTAYVVSRVAVTGLDTTSPTNCAGKSYRVTLAGPGGTELLGLSGTAPLSGTAFSVMLPSDEHVAASGVTAVAMAISG